MTDLICHAPLIAFYSAVSCKTWFIQGIVNHTEIFSDLSPAWPYSNTHAVKPALSGHTYWNEHVYGGLPKEGFCFNTGSYKVMLHFSGQIGETLVCQCQLIKGCILVGGPQAEIQLSYFAHGITGSYGFKFFSFSLQLVHNPQLELDKSILTSFIIIIL